MVSFVGIENQEGREYEKVNGHVYVIERNDGAVKIGRSSNPEDRIKMLSNLGGFEVKRKFISKRCSNAYKLESALHNVFRAKKIKSEWFDVCFDGVVREAKKLKYKPVRFVTKEDVRKQDERIKAAFKKLKIEYIPEPKNLLDTEYIDKSAEELVDKILKKFDVTQKRIQWNNYIKNGLGEDREVEEVTLVKQRVLLMLDAEAWQDIPFKKLVENMRLVDESIRAVKSFRVKSQISMFD